MFGFRTRVADLEKWSKAREVDKIARALSDRDPAIRTAAASALRHVDTHYTSQTALGSAIGSLLKYLNSNDSDLVAEAARALGYFGSNETLGPLFATLDHAKEARVREAAIWAIIRIVDYGADTKEAFHLVFGRLSQQPRLTAEAMDALLYELARDYMGRAPRQTVLRAGHWVEEPLAAGAPEWGESDWGRAFAKLGPVAGRQLVRAGKDGKGPAAAGTAAFGAALVEGCWRHDCMGMNPLVTAALNGDVDSGRHAA
jgi:hypothetical protein